MPAPPGSRGSFVRIKKASEEDVTPPLRASLRPSPATTAGHGPDSASADRQSRISATSPFPNTSTARTGLGANTPSIAARYSRICSR